MARADYNKTVGAFLVPVVVLVVLLGVAYVAIRRFGARTLEQSDRLQAPDRPTLRYQVPPGQDPAVVLGALRTEGYDVSPDSEPGPSSPILIIGAGSRVLEREEVRHLLSGLHELNVTGDEVAQLPPVAFTDE